MTTFQKVIKYLAMAFAIFLTVSIIGGLLSMFGLFGGFFGGDAVTEDIKTYAVSSDIQSLEVKINAADFTIKQGESFSVESNLKHITVEDKIKEMIFTIGEKMDIRRFVVVEGVTSSYIHGGGSIGVIVKFDADDAARNNAGFE